MKTQKSDFIPWLLLPGIVLTFSTVSLLVPHQPVQAASPLPVKAVPAPPAAAATDDGDGDELLEHWGDAKYSHEEQSQLAGMAGGFLVLSAVFAYSRSRKKGRCDVVQMPREADFLKLTSQAESNSRESNSRKAA